MVVCCCITAVLGCVAPVPCPPAPNDCDPLPGTCPLPSGIEAQLEWVIDDNGDILVFLQSVQDVAGFQVRSRRWTMKKRERERKGEKGKFESRTGLPVVVSELSSCSLTSSALTTALLSYSRASVEVRAPITASSSALALTVAECSDSVSPRLSFQRRSPVSKPALFLYFFL